METGRADSMDELPEEEQLAAPSSPSKGGPAKGSKQVHLGEGKWRAVGMKRKSRTSKRELYPFEGVGVMGRAVVPHCSRVF